MSNTTNNHNIETSLVVACFVGFMATNVMAVLAPILRVSPLVLLIAALALVGFFCSEVYPIYRVWRGVGDKAQHVKRIQAIMYLAAVVGGGCDDRPLQLRRIGLHMRYRGDAGTL